MTSLHQPTNDLHKSYCDALGIQLALSMATERMWLESHNQGLTPDDVKLCLEGRLKSNRINNYKFSLTLRSIAGDDEAVANCMNEAAIARATARIKVMDAGKASVLKATHRPTEMPSTPAKAIGDVKLLSDLRKAAS